MKKYRQFIRGFENGMFYFEIIAFCLDFIYCRIITKIQGFGSQIQKAEAVSEIIV